MRLFWDFETRSACDLKEHGVARYYEDPTTQVICLGYAFGDEPASIIKCLVEPIPQAIIDHIGGGNEVVSHGEFDALIWNHVVRRAHPEYPEIKPEQIVDTMAQCRVACIPVSLEKAGGYLTLVQQKQKVGKVLINKLSRPKSLNPLGWNEKPEVLEAMYGYCKQDVETCREIHKTLPPLSDRERRVYALDYRINERGVLCDLEFARSGVRIAAEYKAGLDARIREATNGQVTACSEVKKIGEWATMNGFPIESVAKAELAEMLEGSVPDNVRQVLEYRQDYAKTSTAKLVKLLDMVSADGRLRWQFRYHGASTGRWAGRGVQLQNLPRIPYDDKDEARFLVNQIKTGADLLSRPLDKISSVLRGAFISDGSFVGADFSAIECRVLAWLAGQQDVLDVFARKEDPYCYAASQIYGRPITKANKAERAVGKVTILACIAEGQNVLTDAGLVPIEQVTALHKVWDGETFVLCGGAIYKGVKETIEYDGLCATTDHLVWAEGGWKEFGACAAEQVALATTGLGGCPIRLGDSDLTDCGVVTRKAEVGGIQARYRSMRGVCDREVDISRQSSKGVDEGVSDLQPAATPTALSRSDSDVSKAALHQYLRSKLAELRRAWHQVRVSWGSKRRIVGFGESRAKTGRTGARSDQQRWQLRTRELALGIQTHKCIKQAGLEGVAEAPVPATLAGGEIRRQHDEQPPAPVLGRRDCGAVGQTFVQTKRHVWDLLDCGPNARFTVAGKLVHNCGYQGHMGAFANMAKVYGVKVPDETAKKVISAWRQANGFIVRYWADVARAAFEALKTPGTNKTVGRPGCYSTFRADARAGVSTLKIKLPSGRVLYYPNATAKEEWKYGKVSYSFEYDGQEEGKAVWGRLDSYGGKLVANITSATARDIMVDAMFRVDSQTPIVATVHDELLCEGVQPDEQAFVELMSKSPDWAPDLPMAVESWVGDRYLKG